MESGEQKRNQHNKRRRLQLLAAEKKLQNKFLERCLHGPFRHDLNRILSASEFGPTTKEGCTIDASSIFKAVQDADESLHDEEAVMERWRMMFEGMEFWDDVNDSKKKKRWRCTRKYFETLLRRWVARSSPQNGWTRTRVIRAGQPIEAGSLVARSSTTRDPISSASPPLVTLKFLCSMCARGQTVLQPYRFSDIKRAYFYALVRRPIFIEFPKEDLEPGDEELSWNHCTSTPHRSETNGIAESSTQN